MYPITVWSGMGGGRKGQKERDDGGKKERGGEREACRERKGGGKKRSWDGEGRRGREGRGQPTSVHYTPLLTIGAGNLVTDD